MKDGAIKRTIKAIALLRYRIDLGFTRFIQRLQGEPRHDLHGKCTGCGGCCETPMISSLAPVFYLKSLRWLFLTWQRVVNGFELIEENRKERIFVFRCTHLDRTSKQCDSYNSRPGMCRDYPRNHLYDSRPTFLDGCTFHAVAKNADLIEESLADLDLPPEKLEKIRKEFFVDHGKDC